MVSMISQTLFLNVFTVTFVRDSLTPSVAHCFKNNKVQRKERKRNHMDELPGEISIGLHKQQGSYQRTHGKDCAW